MKVNRAGLVDILGSFGAENIQGEVQQKLDVFANTRFIQAMQARGMVAGVASERTTRSSSLTMKNLNPGNT